MLQRKGGATLAEIMEKMGWQKHTAEAFNIGNSFFVTQQQFNNNPESPNFGSLVKAAVSAPNSNYPRQLQLALKLIW